MKDKIKVGESAGSLVTAGDSSEVYEESVAALVMLGFPKPGVLKAVGKILKEDPLSKVEEVIKMALKIL